jgi:protein N-terminal methyltransferase
LIEPVEKFINEAIARGPRWKGIDKGEKGVTFLRGTLQSFDPSLPISKQLSGIVSCGRLGYAPTSSEDDATFDVIWCQWCLGHLSDSDLISLFKRSRPSLRHMPGRPREGGLIVVKENLCSDGPGDVADTVYDALDASVTRCDDVRFFYDYMFHVII